MPCCCTVAAAVLSPKLSLPACRSLLQIPWAEFPTCHLLWWAVLLPAPALGSLGPLISPGTL